MFRDILKICLVDVRTQVTEMVPSEELDEWKDAPIQLHLPVPAEWDDVACGIIKSAAVKAGLDSTPVILRSEPETAAAHYINEEWRGNGRGVKVSPLRDSILFRH
jgi:hypothetical protein